MKGVIVQVGNPKSIVLLNNGRISSIPTPEACCVGMVVTIKTNSRLKIIALSVAAVLLLAAGIGIGLFASHTQNNGSLKTKQAQELPRSEEKEHTPQDEYNAQQEKPYTEKNYSYQKGKEKNGEK